MKIIKISFDEILIDQKASAKIISSACAKGRLKLAGICELSNSVLLLLVEGNDDVNEFVFAKFAGDDDHSRSAEVLSRYHASFDIVGTFFIDEQIWALYKKRGK